MIRRLVHHANRHSIAYLALVCALLALGGASYAAFKIPNGAVGEKQIKNHVIDPVKWNQTYVTAFIRRYANVDSTGKLITASSFAQSAAKSTPGSYQVTWGDAFQNRCAATATVQSGATVTTPTTTTTPSTTTTTPSTTTTTTSTTTTTPTPTTEPSSGFANTNIVTAPHNATIVDVTTYNAQGKPTPEPFYLTIACPPGAGQGQTFPVTLPTSS